MLADHTIPFTRITLPRRRSEYITRQRLMNMLSELLDKKLVLISAPAGYGKTTLLIDFANQIELPVCWYSIAALDYDPQRFLLNLIAAINLRFPTFGQRALTALRNVQGNINPEYLATVFNNDLYDNVPEHFVLILDDFHLVNDNLLIQEFMSHFLQNADENCHTIITSRTLLTLPVLPLMVARSEVGGLSFEELAFRMDEIQQLYERNQGQALSADVAGQILDKTEGWVTGIVLSAQLGLKRPGEQTRLARVSGVGLDEYFQYLLNQQPDELRDFLLRTSLLEEFDVKRCEVVIGRALSLSGVDWQKLFDEVEKNNLFVQPVGDDGYWLRYHNLFLSFLQMQMRRERPYETVAIENELATLYLENGDWDDAFSILKRLGRVDQLVKLVERAGPDVLVEGRVAMLSAWLDALPSDVLASRPFIVALQGALAATTGDMNLAFDLYDQAINAMKLPEDRRILARALVWRATTYYRMIGDYASAIADAREAISLIEDDREFSMVLTEAQRCVGVCLRMQGKPNEALKWFNQALTVAMQDQDGRKEAMIRMELGLAYENLGEYAKSREMYEAALSYWQKVDNAFWLSNLLNNLGVLQHITGNYQAAVETLEKALTYARLVGHVRLEAFILTGIADIYGELEAYEEANNAYHQALQRAHQVQENFLYVYIHVQQAVLAGIVGEYEQAYRLLENARAVAKQDQMTLEGYLCDLEYAGLKIREGKSREVIPLLEEVQAIFEQEGQKIQGERASLYLTLAYGQTGQREKLLGNLIKVLSHLNTDYPSASLIATAARFSAQLEQLKNLDYVGAQLDDLLERLAKFNSRLPTLRRYLRSLAVSIPFAPPTIYIRALGRMQVKVNNRLLTLSDWQTQAARDLFFLLLAHPEGLTKEEIGLVFWPDAAPEDLKFRIKNTVYRLRHAVGKDAVVFEHECYRFNNQLDYEYDVESFLRENALAQQVKDPLQKLTHYREAIKLYKGLYLAEVNETWVYSHREHLRQNYLSILLQVAEIYLGMSNYELALEYVQRALDEDNCLEAAYRLSFRIYAAMGNRPALVRQYQKCCEVLQREINADPSPQTQALYLELIK